MGVFGLLNLHLVVLFHLAVNLLTELCKFVLQSSVRKGLTEILFLLFIFFFLPHDADVCPGYTHSCVRLHPGVTLEAGAERKGLRRSLAFL